MKKTNLLSVIGFLGFLALSSVAHARSSGCDVAVNFIFNADGISLNRDNELMRLAQFLTSTNLKYNIVDAVDQPEVTITYKVDVDADHRRGNNSASIDVTIHRGKTTLSQPFVINVFKEKNSMYEYKKLVDDAYNFIPACKKLRSLN